MDEEGRVVQYNLAFVVPHLTGADHGRILGYDNTRGRHERHFMGKVQTVEYKGFPATARRFYQEVRAIRRDYESQGIH